MKVLLLTALFAAQIPGGPASKGPAREPHPFAPSLPQLTDQENKEFADIIDRFIEQDTGKLKGPAGTKALADFKALGPEATFALLDGLNKAANMEDSCPAVLIAKKLSTLIRSTKDAQLLEFLRENIGNDVTAKRHVTVLKDLRVACMLRKAELQRIEIASGGKKGPTVGGGKNAEKMPKNMTTLELLAAARKEKGDRLEPVLVELSKRTGESDAILQALATAAGSEDRSTQQVAKGLLVETLSRLPADDLANRLKKGSPEVRGAAARAIAAKGHKLFAELIEALNDGDEPVRQAAREALVRLAERAVDHGPEIGASSSQRIYAQQQWKLYWQK